LAQVAAVLLVVLLGWVLFSRREVPIERLEPRRIETSASTNPDSHIKVPPCGSDMFESAPCSSSARTVARRETSAADAASLVVTRNR
jgi:hypothetical protein